MPLRGVSCFAPHSSSNNPYSLPYQKLLYLADDVISTLQGEGYLELTGEQN